MLQCAPLLQAPIAAAFGSMTSNATVKSTDNMANTFPVVKASSGADQDTWSASASVQNYNTEREGGRKELVTRAHGGNGWWNG